jgi:hypothetical protein
VNPEFVRNLWLEAGLFRLVLIAGLLLLVFAVTTVAPTGLATTRGAALALYWFFTVLWGTRSAALSVVGEIRERTWDSQKLSSIGPIEMVWGKLFGATIHNWFGGVICLPFILLPLATEQGVRAALVYAVILITLGIFAQAAALLSSLVLIRRNTGNWRLDTFLCQVAGIVAAFAHYSLWSSASAFASSSAKTLSWWGITFNLSNFHLASLLLFTAWVLVGCWRAMRAELRFANGPFVWLAWLLYIALYQAGFESWISAALKLNAGAVSPVLLRLALGWVALLASAYSMVFLEPKDPVRLRWLGERLRAGEFGKAFLALDAWMLSYVATLAAGLALALLWAAQGSAFALPVLAMLGFLTRDVAIFVLMRRFAGAKADFAALAVLAALYLLLPMLLRGAALVFLFLPQANNLAAVSALAAWVQGIGAAWWAIRSIGAKFTAH